MNQPPNYSDDFIDLRQYGSVLWRWKWLLILGAILAGTAAFITSRLMTPVYAASTTVLINEASDSQLNDYSALLMSERLARTYAEMLSNHPVLEETLAELELEMDLEDLERAVEVNPLRDTQLIVLTVEHTNPFRAADIANTLVEVFVKANDLRQQSRFAVSKASLQAQLERLDKQIEETESAIEEIGEPIGAEEKAEYDRLQLELAQYQASFTDLLQSYEDMRVAEAQSVSNVVQVEPAEADLDPVRPRTLMNTVLAAAVGGMLALGVVFLFEYLDDTVKSPEQVERELGLPVLGTIARIPDNDDEGLHVVNEPRSPITEAFRTLRTNIQFAAVDHPIHTLLITSAGPEEGKSTVTANLGAVVAQGGRTALILEADLRRPRVHKLLNLTRSNGLSDLFVNESLSLDDVQKETSVEVLSVVTSGDIPPNPAELLGSDRMTEILKELEESVDIVLIDSSPASVVTDSVVLSEKVDAVLLVVEPGKTELPAAEYTVESLRRAGANTIGVVMNNLDKKRLGYYGRYRYQYTNSYESDAEHGSA